MSKVTNFTKFQTKDYKKMKGQISQEKTLKLFFRKSIINEYKNAYLNADFTFIKKRLKKCNNTDQIFEVFLSMISQKIIPVLCSPTECGKCIELNIESREGYKIGPVLQKAPFTPEIIERFKNKDPKRIYAKVTEDAMHRFKMAFLTHDNYNIAKLLQQAKNEVDVLNIICNLVREDVFPIFWPLISEYDYSEEIILEVYLD